MSVQSMTNTDTLNVEDTLAQVRELAAAGADIVRVSVPDLEAARSFGRIKRQSPVPLVADIHFNHKVALAALEEGADGLRLNPGNIGKKEHIHLVAMEAKARGVPIRIGVNAGSLETDLLEKYHEPCPEALVESALRHADLLEEEGFTDYKISVKASDVGTMVQAYRLLAEKSQAPLHLGVTEAGGARLGTVKSSLGIGMLLAEGIGDTIRVSLAAPPQEEVKVGWDILRSLGIRYRGVQIIACPTCARQEFDVLAVVQDLESRLADIKTPFTLSVIGCVVNGPGEALVAQVGIAGGKRSTLYIEGKRAGRLDNENLAREVEAVVRQALASSDV